MGKYNKLAKDIVENVGGEENISGLVHCVTRLRFTLKDEKVAKTDVLKNMDGVVTVMQSGGQYQVVIGNHVPEVYEEVREVIGLKEENNNEDKKDQKTFDKIIDVVSGIFQPVLGIMAACGILKGVNTLLVTLGLYTMTSGVYLVINAAGDAMFTFLPLFLGYTSAKKFGLKPMIGLALAAAMCYPGIQGSTISKGMQPMFTMLDGTMFASPVYINFLGLPIVSIDYTGTVIPIILTVWFAAKCEKFFTKYVPDNVKFFFVPMLTILVAFPVAMIVLGPIATFGSQLISQLTLAVRDFSPLLAGLIVGATWQILVIFGMHWGFIPVYINNVVTLGYDNVMMPFYACTFATSAVVLAIYFKTKDKKMKEMAIPNFISGIFGVTEPAIYGMLLPLKKPFIISCIASAVGGAFYGHYNFRKFVMGGMGIFELPNMMNPDGSMGNIIVAFAGIAISMVTAFVLMMLFYKEPDVAVATNEAVANTNVEKVVSSNINNKITTENLVAPMTGEKIALEKVEDMAFSSGAMGQGFAIKPKENSVVSPANAEVTVVFPTGHAIGLVTESGAEVLIHIGMDTVQLNGEGFTPHVKVGDKVNAGDKLVDFDKDFIESKGYSLVTPVVITNSADFDIKLDETITDVNSGQKVMEVTRK